MMIQILANQKKISSKYANCLYTHPYTAMVCQQTEDGTKGQGALPVAACTPAPFVTLVQQLMLESLLAH